MKRQLLLTAAFIAGGFAAQAQLTVGSTCPDFTVTDQWGNSHTLSTYTSQGKSVIIDVSATWCPPCWAAHEAHVLKDIHNAYGPNGSDEVVVLYLEGDDATTTADLQGTGSNTQGDWLTGSPYPICDNTGNLTGSGALDIGGFPQFYVVCPDGTIGFEQAGYSGTLKDALISAANACSANTGVTDHAEMINSELAICGTNGAPSFDFTNYGTNSISSATVELRENGNTVATENFSGSVAQFESGTVTFPSMTINGGATYTAVMTTVNGSALANPTPNNTTSAWNGEEASLTTTMAGQTDASVTVNFLADTYAEETYMEIVDGSGTVIWFEGNENVVGLEGTGSGTPPADATNALVAGNNYSWTVSLPAVDCYTFRVLDYWGDGINASIYQGGADGSLDVENNTGSVVYTPAALNFGASDDGKVENNSVGIEELNLSDVSIYPNPASDMLNVEFSTNDSNYSVAIMDITGRVIDSVSGSSNVTFPVSNLASGSYMITITTDSGVYTENVVIQ